MSCEGQHGGQALADLTAGAIVVTLCAGALALIVFACRCAWEAGGAVIG